MKKDGKINTKLLVKMLPAAVKNIGQEMFNECKNISKCLLVRDTRRGLHGVTEWDR